MIATKTSVEKYGQSEDTSTMSGCHETGASVLPSHVLVSTKMVELVETIRESTRIKYVCLSVSEHLVALGTSTGVVYIYDRYTKRCVHVIVAETEGSVVGVSLNREGSMLAYATSKGHVLVSKLRSVTGGKPERVCCTSDHYGSLVTFLQWTDNGAWLFIGDDQGKVSRINFYLPAVNKKGASLRPVCELVVNLECPVVQIDTFGETHVLISTRTKSFLCYVDRQQFLQIGKKPRDGKFGACFLPQGSEEEEFIVYCSRPGSRIWEVSMEGDVLNTHQFKQLLNIPPTTCIDSSNYDLATLFSLVEADGPQSLQFPQLYVCCEKFLITCTNTGIYLLNPLNEEVILWNEHSSEINDFCCYKNTIFLLESTGDLQQVEVLTLDELISRTYTLELWQQAATLLTSLSNIITHDVTKHVTGNMVTEIMEKVGPKYTDDLRRLLNDLKLERNQGSSNGEEPQQCDIKGAVDEEGEDTVMTINNTGSVPSDVEESKSVRVNDETILTDTAMSEEYSIGPPIDCPRVREKYEGAIGGQFPEDLPYSPAEKEKAQSLTATDFSPCTPTGGPSVGSELSADSGILLRQYSDEDSLGNHSDQPQALRRQGSLSSLNSLTSMSSSEITYAGSEADQEPVCLVRHEGIRRSKKVKPSIVALEKGDEKNTKRASARKVRRQKSLTSRSAGNKSHLQDGSTVEISSVTNKASPASSQPDSLESSIEGKDSGVTSSQESCELSMTTDAWTGVDVGTELEECVLEVPVETEGTPGGSTRRMKLLAVKDRLSSKVKTTTKSVIQNIKDKKTQITEKVRKTTTKEAIDISLPEIISPYTVKEVSKGETEKEKLIKRPVDLTALIQATEAASEQLEVDSVMYNVDASGLILNAWVQVLHQTLHELQSKVNAADKEEIDHQEPKMLNDSQVDVEVKATTSQQQKLQQIDGEGSENKVTKLEQGGVLKSEGDLDGCRESDVKSQSGSESGNMKVAPDTVDIQNGPAHKLEQERANSDKPCGAATHGSQLGTDGFASSRIKESQKLRRQDCYLTDPFGLSEDTFQKCSLLAQMCFSLGYHGNISQIDHQGNSPPTHNIETPKDEICDLSDLIHEPGEGSKTVSDCDSSSLHQTRGTDDEELSRFLRCYFFLFLDKMEAVDSAIKQRRGERAVIWKALVDSLMDLTNDDVITGYIMDQEVDVAMDILRSEIGQHKLRLRAYLLRLYGIVPFRTLEFCAEMHRYIDVLDVYFIVKLGSKLRHHFIHYVRRLLDKNNNLEWRTTLVNINRDPVLRQAVITCLLECSPQESLPLSCSCGQPRPGAHLVEWPEESLLTHMLELGSPSPSERLMFADHGYWRGYLWLCMKEKHTTLLQQLVLHLDDIRLVNRDGSKGYYPASADDWEQIIHTRCQQLGDSDPPNLTPPRLSCLQCGSDLYCYNRDSQKDIYARVDRQPNINKGLKGGQQQLCREDRITVEILSIMMVRDVGVRKGLEILQRLRIPAGHLPVSFYTSCVVAAAIQTQQSCLSHQMIERVDTYSWSIRTPTLPPQISLYASNYPFHHFRKHSVAAAVQQEKLERSMSLNVERTLRSAEKMFGGFSRGRPLVSTLEDQGTHWGVTMATSKPCRGCGCLLQTPVSLHVSGCVVYKCGHSFHRACSSADFCILCSTRC